MIKLVDNYWVDENNNKWNKIFYTEEVAVKLSSSMTNCTNCINCINCINCTNCRNCRDCTFCRHCINCINCTDCTDWKQNPERIVSPILGSRRSQTTIYFLGKVTQVICGCFSGTLKQFKIKIKETHKDNNYAKEYFAWIERVERYIHG